ncbi:enoyl-CoA hydratase [Leucobacter luti]|uniref:3-hydroxyisobutyryl-CoA hydrolase n=1 Tax=Leucobacter luti TaxID=340320 RepID=A0A4R6S4K5_9MICO|nr:enoyl-CoA hydratase/isomerase family protein [Leucobacter luti]TDP94642.1 enoyl-CoA hydratase [Leucobacter luti]
MSTEASANDTPTSGAAPSAVQAVPVVPAEPLVRVRHEGTITHITLNRPRAINALSQDMFRLLAGALREAREAHDESSESASGTVPRRILLDGAGERGFCGGGDIKELSGDDPRPILALEYAVDYRVATSPVPVVAIMDGITMGGGIGLGGHAAYRVVTERSRLAMPEARIGIAPDVGGHFLLARAPGRLGELLAVTAGEFGAADAIALGFADVYVRSDRLEALRIALAAGEDVAEVLARLAEPAPERKDGPSHPVMAAAQWWDPIAESALGDAHPPASVDPAAAAVRLIAALEASGHPAAVETAATVRAMCPTSVAVTLAQLDRTRRESLDLAAVLTDDLRVLGRIGARADFVEGVRAQVIDKDRTPAWVPASIEELNREELMGIVDPALLPGETALELSADAA